MTDTIRIRVFNSRDMVIELLRGLKNNSEKVIVGFHVFAVIVLIVMTYKCRNQYFLYQN